MLETSAGHLIIHLGMSGSLRVLTHQDKPQKHDHVDLCLDNDKIPRLNDPRRFGSVHFSTSEPASHWLLKDLGVEPLGNEFSGEILHQLSRKRKVAVKSFIMDSKVVVGVGNIYAAEALFRAAFRPSVAAGRIPKYVYERLAQAIRFVLARSVQQGGTTLRDFVGSDGQPGYFRQQLNVYGRGGLPCRACDTTLKEYRLGQRSTVYCPNCQPIQGFAR